MNSRLLRPTAILLLLAVLITTPSPLTALAAARQAQAAGPLSEAEIARLMESGGWADALGIDLESMLAPGLGRDRLPDIPTPASPPTALPERPAYQYGGFLRHYTIEPVAGGGLLELPSGDGASGTEWQLLPLASGALEIQSVATGQCLDAGYGAGGSLPGLTDYDGNPYQEWTIQDIGGGDYVLTAAGGELYLAMDAGGTTVVSPPAAPYPAEVRWHLKLTWEGTDAPGVKAFGLVNEVTAGIAYHAQLADSASDGWYEVTLQAADDDESDQRWSFVDAGGGLYSIKASSTETCLTAGEDDSVGGSEYSTAASQRWRIVDAGGGYYRLFPASAADRPLERVESGGEYLLQLAAAVSDDAAQLWTMPAKTASIASDLEDEDTEAPVFLYARHSNLFLEPLDGSADADVQVVQNPFKAGESQQWRITDEGDGYYSITNEDSGQALTATGTENGDAVEQRKPTNGDDQLWRFVRMTGTGFYLLQPKLQPVDESDPPADPRDITLYLSIADGSLLEEAEAVLEPMERTETTRTETYVDPADGKTKERTVTEVTYSFKESQQWSFFRAESDKFAYTKYYPDLSVKYALGSYEIGRIYDPAAGRGSLGFGWHLAYQYAQVKDYNDDPETKVKIVRLPDGGKYLFEVDGSNFKASDSRAKLAIVGTEYVLTLPDQSSYRFDKEQTPSPLVAVADKYGNDVTIGYDADGLVDSVSDGTGREFAVTYDDGLVVEVAETFDGEPVRAIGYEHTGGLLTAVTGDANKALAISYDYQGLLSEIRDGNGDLLEGVDFFRDGKQYGKVMRMIDVMGNVRTYDYASHENSDGTTVSTVRITDALGLVKENVNDRKDFIRTVTDYEDGVAVAVSETKYTTVTEGDSTKNKYDEAAYEKYNSFTTSYTHDANGNVEQTTRPDGSVHIKVYNAKNSLIAEVDEVGYGTFNVYADDGVTLLTTYRYLDVVDTSGWSSGGAINRATVEAFIATLDETNSAVATYTYYDEHVSGIKGLAWTLTDYTGVTTFEYNERGLVNSVTGPGGGATTYEYGLDGLIATQTSPGGRVRTFTYDDNGRSLSETKLGPADDSTSTREYDSSGRVTADVDALGNEVTFQYWFGSSKPWVKTTPDGYSQVSNYTVYGAVAAETRPDGYSFSYTHDALGRRLAAYLTGGPGVVPALLEAHEYDDVVDGEEYTTQSTRIYFDAADYLTLDFKYDYAGREIEVESALGTQYTTYYADGRVESVTDVAGRIKTMTYGPLCGQDNFVSVTEADGSWSKYTYDPAGRATALFRYDSGDTLLETTTWTYDASGSMLSETKNDVLRVEYEYDADTDLTREVRYLSDGLAKDTTYEYNHLGEPSAMIRWVEPDDVILSAADNTIEADGLVGLVTTYAYDLAGNLISETRPDGSLIEYTYDALNRRCGEKRGEFEKSVVYDWQGRPLEATDMNGNRIVYEYGPNGEEIRAYQLVDGYLAVRAAWYDLAGRKIAEVLPANFQDGEPFTAMNRMEYDYDAAGHLVAQRYVGTELTWDPEEGEWAESYVDRVDRAFAYDDMGNVVKELDGDGYERAAGATFAQKVANGDGPWRRYDVRGNLVAEGSVASVDAGLVNGNKRYEYDQLGRKVAEFDGSGLDADGNLEGLLVRYSYDGDGNVTGMQFMAAVIEDGDTDGFPGGDLLSEQSYTYNLGGSVLTATGANGATTEHSYNMLGLAREDGLSGDETIPETLVSYQYDVLGRVARQMTAPAGDQDGRVQLYTYDRFDRLISETEQAADGSDPITKAYAFDGNGNRVLEIDGNGNQRFFTFNELNKPRAIITRTGEDAWLGKGARYDLNGNETAARMIVVSGGKSVERLDQKVYDPRGREIASIDTFGTVVQKINYSAGGLPVEAYDALDSVSRVQYDADARQIKSTDPCGNTTEQVYDLAGRVVEQTDGAGNQKWTAYDPFGQVVAIYEMVGEFKTQTMAATYNASADIATRTDGRGGAVGFAYNVRDLMVARSDPSGMLEQVLEYDAYGNVLRTLDRNGAELRFAYDIHGRKVEQASAAGTITFAYDGNGNIVEMTDESGTTTSTYDPYNRLLTKEVPSAGTLRYRYDVVDGVRAEDGAYADIMVDPAGNVTTRVFDASGRLQTVKDGEPAAAGGTSYEYYPTGMRKSVTYPNGYRETYEYYANNQLKALRNWRSDATLVDEYEYTYDGAGNQITEFRNGYTKPKATSTLTEYVYDARGQVVEVRYGEDKTIAYAYDLAGNRTQELLTETGHRSVTDYGFDVNGRLVSTVVQDYKVNGTKEQGSVTTTEYAYDANGNQLRATVNGKVAEVRTYDPYSQLIEAKVVNKAYRYTYDAGGKMVAREDGGVVTHYVYDGEEIALELDKGGKQVARNLRGINLLARTDLQSTFYYLYNGHGDVMSLVSNNGVVVREYAYDAFGEVLDSFREKLNPYRHAGAFWDYQTGLYMLGSRAYDPNTARFLQEDYYLGESEDPLSLNLYAYCRNNPLKYVDPTGHFFFIIIVLAVVGAVLATGAVLAADLIDDGKINTDWRVYVGAAVGGLLSGACMGVGFAVAAGLGAGAFGMALAGAIAGAVGGLTSTLAQDLIDDGSLNTDWRYYLAAGVVGAIMGAVGGYSMGSTATAASGAAAKESAKAALYAAARQSTKYAIKQGLITLGKEIAKGVGMAVGIKIVKDLILTGGFDTDWKSWVHTLVEGAIIGVVRGAGMEGLKAMNLKPAAMIIGGGVLSGAAAATARIVSYYATDTEVNWTDVAATGALGFMIGMALGYSAYKAKEVQTNAFKPDPKASWWSNFSGKADWNMKYQFYSGVIQKAAIGVSSLLTGWAMGEVFHRFERDIYNFGFWGDTSKYAMFYFTRVKVA